MPDIFDQVQPDKPAAPMRDIFDQVQPDQPAPPRPWVDYAANAPGVPPPPLPQPLKTEQQQIEEAPVIRNRRTGLPMRDLPAGQGNPLTRVLDSPITGGREMVEGAEQMAQPGLRQKAGGLHKVISGGFEAATPLMIGTGIAAPVATAATLTGAMAAQTAVEKGLKALGLAPEYADVAGDLSAFLAGGAVHKLGPAAKASIKSKLEQRWEAKQETAGTQYTSTGQEIRTPGAATAATAAPAEPLKPSDMLPTPDQVDAQTTANARTIVNAALASGQEQVPQPLQPALPAEAPPEIPKEAPANYATTMEQSGQEPVETQQPETSHQAASQTAAARGPRPGAPSSPEPGATEATPTTEPAAGPPANAESPLLTEKLTGKDQEGSGPEQAKPPTAEEPRTAATPTPETPPVPETPEIKRGEPGWVGNIPTSEIQVDAPRFQFKRNVGQGGAGEEFREVSKWDPEKAGVVSVWRDPEDGKTYIVNGHHRMEMATRLGAPLMTVRYLNAETAQQARAKGALINIAEGRGESTDAARVFRDTGMSAEDLQKEGVSLKGKIAKEGLAVSKLAQPIYDDVQNGDLSPARGAVIGEGVTNPQDQLAVYDLMKRREQAGKRMTNDQVAELARLATNAPQRTETQDSLFGTEEMTRSLLPERAEVSDYVRKQLASERKLFGVVGTQAAAERLGEAGNVIQAGENKQRAETASQGIALYDKLSTVSGPIATALDRASERIADGEKPDDVKREAYRQIKSALLGQASQLAGVPQVDDGRTEGLGSEGPREVSGGERDPRSSAPEHQSGEPGRVQAEPHRESGLFDADTERQSKVDAQRAEDKLLGDQLTAQIHSGMAARPANLKPAENEGLFDEERPEQPDFWKNESGSAPPDILGVGKFLHEDVAPTVSKAARGVAEAADDILKVLAPQLRSPQAKRAGLILRDRAAELARNGDQAAASLRGAKRVFDRQPREENYEFIRRVEAGQKQKTPALDTIAGVLRKMLDAQRREVQSLGTGKLQRFYENYFPHLWEDPKKAAQVFASLFGKRPLEGSKGFLKRRTHLTFEDGLNAGLKPVSDNPVDLALLKMREIERYVMAHRVLNEWKGQKLARFVDARNSEMQQGLRRSGWRQIMDPIGTVYGPSIQQITEYPNAGIWTGLQTVAEALGLKQERGFLNLHGAIGRAQKGTGRVQTLHGTAEDVLAHEIGHQIDWLAGSGKKFVLEYPDAATVARLRQARAALRDTKASTPEQRRAAREELENLKPAIAQRKEFARQLRALADLRSGEAAYTHKREEKMALLAEMWVGSRQLFARTAPEVFSEWKKFLNENPKLHALRDIEGNTEVTPIAQPYDVGGLVVKGHWWAPEGGARILDNYLSPGLRSKSGAYRALLGANNVLNQAQLGLSAFHLGFTSADAAVSKGALAIEQLVRGNPLQALKTTAQVPTAPVTNWLTGNRLLKEWQNAGSQGPEISAIADALVKGGGRAHMDEMYQTNMGANMMRAFRNGNLLGGLVRAPFAGLEGLSNIIMKEIVPRQKLGVFADLARFELDRLGPDATTEQVRDSMAKIWDSVENRMGEMTYDNLFWNRTAKDLAMLGVRSVGWNLGTIREIGGAGIDAVAIPMRLARGTQTFERVNIHRLSYVASLAITAAVMGAIYQRLATGKGPGELKDYYFPKTGQLGESGRPQRVSMPTYVKDVYHYATEPGKTLADKASPLITLTAEMVRNKDFYGQEIRNSDDPLIQQMLDATKHVVGAAEPFGIRNLEKETKLGAPTAQRVQQFVGITPAPAALEKTHAELLAGEFAQGNIPAGAHTKAEVARRGEERTIGRLARLGRPAGAEIQKALRAGTLTIPEVRRAIAEARMDPLARTFKGLPMDQALKVWKAATTAERKRLRPLLIQKGKTIASKSPTERATLLPQFVAALRGQ